MLDIYKLDIKKFRYFKSLEEIEAVVTGCIPQDYYSKLTVSDLLRLDLLQYETGLKIITTQIHGIVRDGKLKLEISVAGYRAIADRTGKYGGNEDPLFNDKYTQFQMEEQKIIYPTTATVTVWKIVQGTRCPFTATASWNAYAARRGNELTFMWKNKPYLMLGKIAESLALRKAFPLELSSLYTQEEMEHVDNEQKVTSIPSLAVTSKSLIQRKIESKNSSVGVSQSVTISPENEKIQDPEKALEYAINKLGLEKTQAINIIQEHDYNRKKVMEAFNQETQKIKQADNQIKSQNIEPETLIQEDKETVSQPPEETLNNVTV